jgi:hypothetical protein
MSYVVLIAIVGALGYLWYYRDALPKSSAVLTPHIAEIVLPHNPLYSRTKVAPNGSPWPPTSNYVPGYPRLNVFGTAEVTADNSGGQSDLFVKLIDLDQKPATAARVGFVKAKDELSFFRVKPGQYDIRYKNLDSGVIKKSPPFEVTLKKTSRGEEYMGWTVPLYEDFKGTTYHAEIYDGEF